MQLEDNQLIQLEDNQLIPLQDNQLIPLEDDSIVTDTQDYFDLLQTSNNINQLVTTTHLSKFYNPKNWKIVVGCLSRLDEPLVAKLVRDLDSCLHLPIEIFIDQLLNRGHIALVFENLNYRNFISILVKLPKRNLLKVCKHLVDHDIQPLATPEIVFDLVRDLNISRKVICSIIAVSSKSILLDLTRVWSNCVFVDSAPILYQVRIAAALVCAADLHPFDSESSMLFMKSIGNFLAASRVETRELGMTVAEIITQKLGQAKLEFDIESRYKWLADRSADEIKQPKIEMKSQHVPKGKSIISMVDDINPDESVLTRSNLEFPKKNPRTKSVPWFLPEALRMLGDRDGCLDALLYIPRLIEQASQVELESNECQLMDKMVLLRNELDQDQFEARLRNAISALASKCQPRATLIMCCSIFDQNVSLQTKHMVLQIMAMHSNERKHAKQYSSMLLKCLENRQKYEYIYNRKEWSQVGKRLLDFLSISMLLAPEGVAHFARFVLSFWSVHDGFGQELLRACMVIVPQKDEVDTEIMEKIVGFGQVLAKLYEQ